VPLLPEALACTSPYLSQYGTIFRCRSCGLVYAEPPLDETAVVERYRQVSDPVYLMELDHRRAAFAESLHDLHRWVRPPGRLLEIGAHIGLFLSLAQAAGWEAVGVEPSAWAVAYGRREWGVDLREGTQAIVSNEPPFDVVVAWDVLEHLTDPKAELLAAGRKLKAGGWLALSTVNIASLAARLLGPRWPWLMRMHLYYFTPQTLRRYLIETGFQVEWLGSQRRTFDLAYVTGRILAQRRYLKRTQNLFVNKPWSRWSVTVNFGDIMVVYARKL